MKMESGANGRTETGVYHLLPHGATRTACGRVPAWNWLTASAASGLDPDVSNIECKRCLGALRKIDSMQGQAATFGRRDNKGL